MLMVLKHRIFLRDVHSTIEKGNWETDHPIKALNNMQMLLSTLLPGYAYSKITQ